MEQNRRLPRGHLQVCPGEVEIEYKLVQGCFYIGLLTRVGRGGGGGVRLQLLSSVVGVYG